MSPATMSCALLLLLSPLLSVAQLVGTPPSCVSYHWDSQPVPKEVYKCESFTDFVDISDTKELMVDQYFSGVKYINKLRLVNLPSEGKLDFPNLKTVGSLEIAFNSGLQYLALSALEKADSIKMSNLTKLKQFDMGALKYVKTFDYQFVGYSNLTLKALREVDSLTISNNDGLGDLRLPSLLIATTIVVERNPDLMQLYTPQLKTVEYGLTVADNANMYFVHVPELSAIRSVLKIHNLGRLSNLHFPELKDGWRLTITISSNPLMGNVFFPELTRLSWMDKIGLKIVDNPQLTAIHMDALKEVGGLEIQGNRYLYFADFASLEMLETDFILSSQFMNKLDGSCFPKLTLPPGVQTQMIVPNLCCSAVTTFLDRVKANRKSYQCKNTC